MATAYQRAGGQELSQGASQGARLPFAITGAVDEADAMTALLASAPATYSGLARHTYHLRETEDPTIFEAEVEYGDPDTSGEIGTSSYNFEVSSNTTHITHSKQTVANYVKSPYTALDFQSAIGVTSGLKEVSGCDILTPAYSFSETHILADSFVTSSYKASLAGLVGKVNGSSFKGFNAGEVLFIGARGSKRGYDRWEVSYNFMASQNASGLVIGTITGIDKKGWEYLWVYYSSEEDTAGKRLVKRPYQVVIEQVYDYANFSGIGIGT